MTITNDDKSINELERLAEIWGLDVIAVQKAWNSVLLGGERQKKGRCRLSKVEALVFLLNVLNRVDCLTASSATNLYRDKFDEYVLPGVFCKYLNFLVEKMPDEIAVDKTIRPKIFFTSKNAAKIKEKREKEQKEAVEKKERLRRLIEKFIPESEGNQPLIKRFLEEQGIKIDASSLWKFINDNQELRLSFKYAREAKKKRLDEARAAKRQNLTR